MKSIKAKVLMAALASGLLVGGLSYLSSTYAAEAPFRIANGGVIETEKNGSIDWTKGMVTVKGIGAAPANVSTAQKRPMAIRAATADAYRNLAEIVNGVRVDSTTIVKNFVTESDEIKTQVTALIKGARMVGQPKYFDDGTVEVTMAISIYGPSGLFDIVEDKLFEKGGIKTAQETPPPPSPTNIVTPPPSPPTPPIYPTIQPISTPVPPTPPPTVEPPTSGYTGVIVDARKLGVEPAMSPRLLDPSGKELYVGSIPMDPDFVVNTGIVGYATTIDDAKKNTKRVGTNPLVLKGLKASGPLKGDIVISDSHAKALQQVEKEGRCLQNASIIILL